jgi:bifunctional non-homologous end joining protein LigD
MEQITLYYQEGSSDKVYQASIEPRNGGYVVNYAFGRRGTTLQTGTKTQQPVEYNRAKAIFDRLVEGKKAKGYSPGENGTPYHQTAQEGRSGGIRCQLLNPVDEAEAERLVHDRAFCLQEKMDGRRLLIAKQNGEIRGINRLSLIVGVPESIAEAASQIRGDFVLDGEAIGDVLHAFDLLSVDGADLRPLTYELRLRRLTSLIQQQEVKPIELVATAFGPAEKALAFCTLKAQNREGVVFKRLDAGYSPGRPASGGSQLKYKFCETASFIVGALNEKRSISLMLFRDGGLVPAGNVTLPPNHDRPVARAVVECRYLYAFRESGAIYQPVYLGRRDDITPTECVVEQLKYKPDEHRSEDKAA